MLDITVKSKNVYGNDLIYPVSKDAKMLCELAGTKTVTQQMIRLLYEKGYTITEVTR